MCCLFWERINPVKAAGNLLDIGGCVFTGHVVFSAAVKLGFLTLASVARVMLEIWYFLFWGFGSWFFLFLGVVCFEC